MARVTLPGHDQSTYRLRMEWGPTGAEALPADYAVVVDVLSFTTTLSVALDRGIEVYPFRWKDSRAAGPSLSTDAGAVLLTAHATKDGMSMDLSGSGWPAKRKAR